jgi:hypothetical protein
MIADTAVSPKIDYDIGSKLASTQLEGIKLNWIWTRFTTGRSPSYLSYGPLLLIHNTNLILNPLSLLW